MDTGHIFVIDIITLDYILAYYDKYVTNCIETGIIADSINPFFIKLINLGLKEYSKQLNVI